VLFVGAGLLVLATALVAAALRFPAIVDEPPPVTAAAGMAVSG
jgi:hypothetical protein